VLASEVLQFLGGANRVLDGTLGGGGHSAALLLGGVANVVGIDRDPDALASATQRLTAYVEAGRFEAHLGNFYALDEVPALAGQQFDGLLLDLGISSHQVDELDRGFSFREGAPLDMRMSGHSSEDSTAAELLNTASERELHRIFREYGDEPRAGRLAREVVRRRGTRPLAISDDLVGAIRGALGPRTGPGDFARIFQGVRIAVNDELAGLERALPILLGFLVPGGVMAVIAYHSGEDRLVKHAFREWSAACICPPKQIVCTCRGRALGELLTRRAIKPTLEEVERNPRARSAHLRVFKKDVGWRNDE
jgi:16S rRNA (cytosine1402-N4)-methyltransferase